MIDEARIDQEAGQKHQHHVFPLHETVCLKADIKTGNVRRGRRKQIMQNDERPRGLMCNPNIP